MGILRAFFSRQYHTDEAAILNANLKQTAFPIAINNVFDRQNVHKTNILAIDNVKALSS